MKCFPPHLIYGVGVHFYGFEVSYKRQTNYVCLDLLRDNTMDSEQLIVTLKRELMSVMSIFHRPFTLLSQSLD